MHARGERYIITPRGYIKRTDMQFKPSSKWKLLGISTHWMKNYPDLDWQEVKARLDKKETVSGYVHDIDHGTHRMWSGRYFGKIPKAKLYKSEF